MVRLLAACAIAAMYCAAQTGLGGFVLISPAVAKDGALPAEFTCDGASASPPLTWSNAPSGTRFFAVTMHHIPSPGAEKHVYIVVYNIPANVTSLGKNVHDIGGWGVNTVNRRTEYTPPCSKGPGAKTYTLTVYALSSEAKFADPAKPVTMDMLLAGIQDKTLGTATLDVHYSRSGGGGGTEGRPGGPRPPQAMERALSELTLSGEQKEKVQAMIQQYGEKQRQLREELMKQLKTVLDAEQYSRIEAASQQPGPPPDRRQ